MTVERIPYFDWSSSIYLDSCRLFMIRNKADNIVGPYMKPYETDTWIFLIVLICECLY